MKENLRRARRAKLNRANPEYHISNFLSNVSRQARAVRSAIKGQTPGTPEFQEAIRNYLCGLVSSLETFYRDMFVYAAEAHHPLVGKAIADLKEDHPKFEIPDDVTPQELASTTFIFQNLRDIERALSPLLGVTSYVQALSQFRPICFVPKIDQEALIPFRAGDSWAADIGRLLDVRRHLTHDANEPCTVERDFVRTSESTVIVVAQLTAILFFEKSGQKAPLRAAHVILSAEDLVANDWVAESDLES